MKYKWTEDISVSDVTIDEQHKRLLDEISVLELMLKEGKSEKHIEQVLEFLSGYITDHLAYEEMYMRAHDFPGYDAHKAQHQEFIVKYEAMKKEFAEGKLEAFSEKVSNFLGQWWIGHISGADQEYEAYINRHPQSHPPGESGDYHETIQRT